MIAGVGPDARRVAHARGVLELRSGHDLVDQADALGVGRGEVVAEEHEFLRFLRADEPRQQVGTAAVGDDPPADEHLDEAGGVGREHEITRERDVRADARGGPVHGADDRLVAVLNGGDQALCPDARAVDGEDRSLGRAVGEVVLGRAVDAQVGTGAERLVAGGGEHDGADGEVAVGRVEQLDDPVALRGCEGVARLRPVEGDPRHTVDDLVTERLERVGRHGGGAYGDAGMVRDGRGPRRPPVSGGSPPRSADSSKRAWRDRRLPRLCG